MINIGFVGTGLMGLPMAKNILKSGLKLSAFNRTINKAEPLKEFGAEISKTLSEVVKDKDYVKKNMIIAEVYGSNHALLQAERVALNYLQTMSATFDKCIEYTNKIKNKKKTKKL